MEKRVGTEGKEEKEDYVEEQDVVEEEKMSSEELKSELLAEKEKEKWEV